MQSYGDFLCIAKYMVQLPFSFQECLNKLKPLEIIFSIQPITQKSPSIAIVLLVSSIRAFLVILVVSEIDVY